MPLDLLLANAGDYERTHQIMLYVLFKEGRLSEHLGLPPAKEVDWEPEKGLFDLTLKMQAGLVTGVEVKTWSTVSADQAERQRGWARKGKRKLAYVLLGFADLEGVPDDPIPDELCIGAEALCGALGSLAKDDGCGLQVRGLAKGYQRWLVRHLEDRLRGLEQPKDRWGRLQWSVAYNLLRHTLGWPADIYHVPNPSGGVHVLNFSDDWHDLKAPGLRGTRLFWELSDGKPTFKIGPVPKGRDARDVRAELRELLEAAAKAEGLPLVVTGRTGEHMSLARGDTCAAEFFDDAKLDARRAKTYLETCRRVHERTIAAWRKR